jgi:hypothetical protein
MDSQLLLLHTQGLMLKIHVITGWKISATEALQNILEDQLQKKLKEDYSNYNVAEIELAFRKYGTKTKDWGKDMNLSLIDTVMTEYAKLRNEVSCVEERMLKAPEREKPTDEQIMSMKRETIEVCYQSFLTGKQAIILMPYDAIATLALDDLCEFNLYENFRTHAFHFMQRHISNEIEDYKLKRKMTLVESKEKELANLSVGDEIVERTAKKMALVYFFSEAQKAGLKYIYTKVDE